MIAAAAASNVPLSLRPSVPLSLYPFILHPVFQITLAHEHHASHTKDKTSTFLFFGLPC
jgi:hypothetical protein